MPLLVGRVRNGFVAVKLPGASRSDYRDDFWITESDLAERTRTFEPDPN